MNEQDKEKDQDKELSVLSPAVRIFLVEDNPDHVFIALTVVRQVLGDDIELVHASNADEALLMIAQFTEHDRPDLFLVDLRLPDNGGFSVLHAGHASLTTPRARPSKTSRSRAPGGATSWYASARCRCRSGRTTRRIATRQ